MRLTSLSTALAVPSPLLIQAKEQFVIATVPLFGWSFLTTGLSSCSSSVQKSTILRRPKETWLLFLRKRAAPVLMMSVTERM
uniref:Putative secreted protein n=1 Tax=Ixodes ricinus TaxID=34613 RepID=A0A6B0TX21_IXORI